MKQVLRHICCFSFFSPKNRIFVLHGMIFDFSMDFRVGILFSVEVHWSPFTITPGSPSIGRLVSMHSSSSESTGGLFWVAGGCWGRLMMLAHLDGNGSWNSTSCLNITLLKSQVLWTDLALWKCLFWQGLPDCHLLDLVGDLAWLHLVCYKRQENLGYLSISQVLADYAMLVQHLQALELQWFFL